MSVSQQDHFELSRLVEAYCDGVIRKDVDTWSSTWADDSEWQMRGDPIVGKQAIVEYWVEAMKRFHWVMQTAPHTVFEVEEGANEGTGRVVAHETFKRADDVMGGLIAIYHDRYVKTDAGWKFAARKLEILHYE